MDIVERYSRQKSLIDLDKLNSYEISVVGIGSVGRQVSLQLASMGVQNLHMIDFDTIEESNVSTQGYWEGDIGQHKVNATAKHCLMVNGTMNLRVEKDRFRKKTKMGDIVFACVDSMKIRKLLFESVYGKCRLFVDGRMAAEVFNILTVWDSESAEHYRTTLFTDAEAHQGSCTAKSIIYSASILAGFEVSSMTKWMRGHELHKSMLFNLVSNEMEIIE